MSFIGQPDVPPLALRLGHSRCYTTALRLILLVSIKADTAAILPGSIPTAGHFRVKQNPGQTGTSALEVARAPQGSRKKAFPE